MLPSINLFRPVSPAPGSSSNHSANSVLFGTKRKREADDTADKYVSTQAAPQQYNREERQRIETSLKSNLSSGNTTQFENTMREHPTVLQDNSFLQEQLFRRAAEQDKDFLSVIIETVPNITTNPQILLTGLKSALKSDKIDNLKKLLPYATKNNSVMNDVFFLVIFEKAAPYVPWGKNKSKYEPIIKLLAQHSSPELLNQLIKDKSVTERLITGRAPWMATIDDKTLQALSSIR